MGEHMHGQEKFIPNSLPEQKASQENAELPKENEPMNDPSDADIQGKEKYSVNVQNQRDTLAQEVRQLRKERDLKTDESSKDKSIGSKVKRFIGLKSKAANEADVLHLQAKKTLHEGVKKIESIRQDEKEFEQKELEKRNKEKEREQKEKEREQKELEKKIEEAEKLQKWREELDLKNKKIIQYFGDGRELAREIGKRGADIFVDIIKKIEAEPLSESVVSKAEAIIKTTFQVSDENKRYPELIDALTEVIMKQDTENQQFRDWSHSVCHLFEKYDAESRGDITLPSYFDSTEIQPSARKLIDESVSRAAKGRRSGSLNRILLPLIQYNFNNLSPDNLDGNFYFKPDSLSENKDKLKPILSEEGDEATAAFISSETPREFIASCIKEKIKLFLRPELMIKLLDAVRTEDNSKNIDNYIAKFYPVNGEQITFDAIKENFETASNATEILSGTYVDVDDTLITGGKINQYLLGRLTKKVEQGEPVIIISGGSPETQTNHLRSLGCPEALLPVRSKDDFKGKILEYLIDDTPAAYQGMKAKNQEKPWW